MGPRAMQRIRNFRRMRQEKLKKGAKDERIGAEKFSMEEEDGIKETRRKKSRMRLRRIGSRSKERSRVSGMGVKSQRTEDG